tara:strand:- start:1113 stop:1280 length:168 start_codon:yes stop_codon:yes gene_type:complete
MEVLNEEDFLKYLWDKVMVSYIKDNNNNEILNKLDENDFHKFLKFYYEDKKSNNN